jgi:hypothetical protein
MNLDPIMHKSFKETLIIFHLFTLFRENGGWKLFWVSNKYKSFASILKSY